MIDRRPANGGGSCASCKGELNLASLERDGLWYCSSRCADGRVRHRPREARVPEPWLYARPRRFYAKRRPKELRGSGG